MATVAALQSEVGASVRLWCLRHAEAEPVTTAATGALPTGPLTAQGRLQAVKAAQRLAAEPITRIYASTAPRAQQTAAILAASRGIPITALSKLVEVRCTADELRAWIVGQDLDQRASNGETGRQVVARVTAALEQIASAHPGETVAVVGHVASLTVALGRLCALGSMVWGIPLPYARPFLVEWDGHAWRCSSWPAVR